MARPRRRHADGVLVTSPRNTRRPENNNRARIQPARRIAYEVLRAVHESDAYANLLLPSKLAEARLSEADAGLATELTYGTLRRQGYYDRVLALVTGRPLDKLDPEVLDVLRLGAHQLLSMRVAPHAAVDESVALVAAAGKRSATGFANGVLRTLTRSSPQEWRGRALAGLAGDRLRAAEQAHPLWIVIFTLINVVWATVYGEHWKRHSSELAYRWGTLDREPELFAEPHPRFRGEPVKNAQTGRTELEYPEWKRQVTRYGVSAPAILVCLAAVCFALFQVCIFIYVCPDKSSVRVIIA